MAAPLTAISTWDESILTKLQLVSFEVATLHRLGNDWQIQRSPHQVHQFFEDLGQGVSLAMTAIPAGEFLMGSPEEEPELAGHEGPQHWVAVPAFLMGQYPVSQAQWRKVSQLPAVKRVLRPNPAPFQGDDYPVREVTWYEAVEFCDRLAQATGRPYRLPTEAEWEYACRAGTSTPFHFGNTISPQLANYNGNHPYADGPVGEYRRDTTPNGYFGVANAFGLYDMHGNVLEWCLDHWHSNYEGAPEDGSPWFNAQERRRIVRGGCWFSPPQACLSYFRSTLMDADESNLDVGFRVVCAP
ncbi:formylglycine-generating enzyme family protein [Leptolyngbya sp. FACHB-16]|nr:formylglycine-generating enzyme family protein [Leptolyngbya sp. FACHB-8]MBD2157389.1 formylglycine-generating enzyme family protein [Leptolyngbya sp. FACHB-16]